MLKLPIRIFTLRSLFLFAFNFIFISIIGTFSKRSTLPERGRYRAELSATIQVDSVWRSQVNNWFQWLKNFDPDTNHFCNHTWVPRESEDIKQFRFHLRATELKARALSYWIFVKQPNLYASPLHLDIFSVRSTLQSHIFGHRRFTFFPRDDDNIERCGLAL